MKNLKQTWPGCIWQDGIMMLKLLATTSSIKSLILLKITMPRSLIILSKGLQMPRLNLLMQKLKRFARSLEVWEILNFLCSDWLCFILNESIPQPGISADPKFYGLLDTGKNCYY